MWHNWHDYAHHVWLWVLGAAIGLGQLLSSDAPLSVRSAIGRALVSGGLGTASGLIVLAFNDVPPIAMFGAAAAIASLGTSALERLLMTMAERLRGRP